MRAAAIREHALAGAVDGDSLAWREGLAEWRPLRTIPELQALVVAVHSARSAMPAIEEPAPAPPAPVVASAEAVFKPLADAPDTVRSEAVAAMAATEQPVPRAAALDQQRANAQAQADLEMVLGRKRSTHPMAYAFIAAAAVFGGVAAYVLLSKPQPQIVVVHAGPTVVVPSTSTAPAPAPATSEPDKAQVDVGDVSPAAPQVTVAKLGGARPKASATTTAGASAPIDTSGFMNIPGPVATPQPGPSQGASQLSQGEISAVVTQNQAIMKRKCWLPALEARPVNGATSARVDGRLVIGASGTVESASASGAERDFPGLASCIAARMKIWKFPPSSGSTPVNVPFVFAGQ